jgi:outer membrane protein TolC
LVRSTIALLIAASAPQQPTTVIQPNARALIADLGPPPPLPPPEGPVLPLPMALALARINSPDLKVLAERVVQARNDVSRAWAQVKPTLTGTGSYTHNSAGPPVFVAVPSATGGTPFIETVEGSPNTLAGALNLQIPIFNGRVFPAVATARQVVDVARLTEAQQRQELLLAVGSTYYSGVQLLELAKVAFRTAENTRDHAIEAQARFEAGQIQRSASVRARVDVLRADEEVRRAVYSYTATKSQLAQLTALRDTAFELEAPRDPPPEIRGDLSELLERAMRDRPEIAAARANVEIAARLKTDAWAQFLPTLALNGTGRYNSQADFQGKHLTWALTLALTLPLYDGGLRYVALKDADSRTREARAQESGQVVRIEDELRRARLDLDSARALRAQSEQTLIYARENERLVRAQFEAGTATQVEVSDAESALFQSEQTAIQQRLAVQLAALRLARSVGAFTEESP